jgi:SAM-dependent methyltransferase
MVARLELNVESHVVEVAANDGYLLQYVRERAIPCTGVEPTASTAAAARSKGIPIVEDFFSGRLARELAGQGKSADLIIANNVLAHVPDVNDFVTGVSTLLKPNGVGSFEFPHLLQLIDGVQFDTIYHEHFSYLSLTSVDRLFTANGLKIFDVEEHPTHGGSLRVLAQRSNTGQRPRESRVDELLGREFQAGMTTTNFYVGFQARVEKIKDNFLAFLLNAKLQGQSVVAYGAAAKGNTLMNYAGIRPDLIGFVADRNPAKQGKYMPGSHIFITAEVQLKRSQPDYVVILPWNLKAELMQQLEYIRTWGGKFVTVVPRLEVMP